MTNITLIAAISLNGVIGDNNNIPFHVPEDLKHFKKTTKGQVVVMGRKTFESIGSKPLPGRDNVVLSKNIARVYPQTGEEFAGTAQGGWDSILRSLKQLYPNNEIFIIGGGEIYQQTINKADKLIISHIHTAVKGSIKFPDIDTSVWKVGKIDHRLDATIPFTIVEYHRIPV